MADFCNQCAKELGFPEGDFICGRKPCYPGYGYGALCDGCGRCFVDHMGNCVDPHCLKQHGKKEK